MVKYEVDLRSRLDGNTIDCILSTEDYDKAYKTAYEWNKRNIENYNENIPNDNWIDGTMGLFADVYEV